MNTSTHQFSRHVSVPSDEGIRVGKAVTIAKPVNEVYSFWRRLENLSRFMRHVECVAIKDDLHSHWVVKTLGGKKMEWDAEIIEQKENEMISWRSAPGADVDNAGSVWFTGVPGGQGTVVRVELKYVPPAGAAGAAMARVFGRDADLEIEEDLNRLKSLLETGTIPEDHSGPSIWRRTSETARRAARATDECVHNHPWSTVAVTALFGLALGMVLGGVGSRSTLEKLTARLK
jgi:uncharacterized membrane protein